MSSENLEIVHEGWLTKSPPAKRVLKAVSVKLKWRRRWFVLRHSGELPGQYFLAYYTDKSRRKMKGRIDLDQCEQVDAGLRFEDRKSKYHYMFDIKTPKRTYYLAAESEEDMNKWVDFVCHVCGLKPFTVDENADFECPSVNNMCRPFPLSVEEHDEEHSSPDSPTSTTSSHYIPISECISGKPLLPILPRSTIEESYDLPRRIRPPPRLSESPPPSPGSESVFTDDESINGSTMSRPSVNWQTFPRLSQNSPDLPVAANRRFTKILPEGCLTAPPRPPKPSHLIETSTKTDKIVEPLTGDETYDFPRSHQMTPPQAQPRTHRRHCYSNAAPGQVVSGNIFTYDFVEDCGPKVEEGKTVELESPSFINSPSAIANVSSASLEQTPPAVNRQLKPGRKFSDTSAELSPLTPLANPPIVNRRLKPTQIKKNQDSFYDTTSTLRLCPPPMGSLSRQKSRIGPNVVPTSFEPRIHRRHSASDDRLASDKVSSYQINKISSNSRYLAEASRFNDIQYLDLEFESCDKQYAVGNRTNAKSTTKKKQCNVGSQFTLVMHDYSMIDGAYPYKTVDFLKTAALSMTRKRAEQERRFGRQNMELDSKCVSNLTIYHELLDVNNDGVVSIEDLKELTERFSKLNDMTDEQTFLFSRIIENLWYKHWGCIDPFDYVTVEKYLKYIQYVKENDGLKDEVVQLLPYLFKTVDKDQNGDISKDEYIKFLECIGTSKKTNLIKSLGIINDKDDTIKLEGLMSIIKKHLFHNKNKTEDTTINNGTTRYQYN